MGPQAPRLCKVDSSRLRPLASPERATSDHILLKPTCNMAHPRCSTKSSQGMCRHRRAKLFG
jgi:hypothetical protein